MNTNSPPKPTPRLYALRFAAAESGMTPESFLQACLRKEIPVSVLKIGERGRWRVDGPELLAWLGNPPHLHCLSKLF